MWKESKMRKLFLLILIFPAAGLCQGFLPRWELSLSADANSFSSSTYSFGQGDHQYISLDLRPAFYPVLGLGLAIEPELAIGATKGQSPAINLSGNLTYSYGMGYWPVVPFVLVGFGLGNGLPFYQPLQRYSFLTASGMQVYNAGVGAKVMIFGGRALVRVEYRYQEFHAKSPQPDIRIFARRILIGFGVLL